jgi:hypothetical protein
MSDPRRLKELAGIKPPKKTHIVRWYDYVVAFVFADFITGWLWAGFFYNGPNWWAPLLYGGGAVLLIRFYTDWYCETRKIMEDNESKT